MNEHLKFMQYIAIIVKENFVSVNCMSAWKIMTCCFIFLFAPKQRPCDWYVWNETNFNKFHLFILSHICTIRTIGRRYKSYTLVYPEISMYEKTIRMNMRTFLHKAISGIRTKTWLIKSLFITLANSINGVWKR